MSAVVGWVVIGLTAFLVYRACRKWRREYRQGLTTMTAAAQAISTATATADAGGVHLHLNLGADALGSTELAPAYGVPAENDDVIEIVRNLSAALAAHRQETQVAPLRPVLDAVQTEREA